MNALLRKRCIVVFTRRGSLLCKVQHAESPNVHHSQSECALLSGKASPEEDGSFPLSDL